MHIDQLDTLYKSNGSRNSPAVTWGHRGQKVIFTKNAISPSHCMVWPWDSCILISKIPSTKVMGLEIHPGSLRVTGVERSFSPKMLFLLQITCLMAMGLMHIDQLDTLYKSYGSRNSPGVTWGHRGQKVIFNKNAISPSDYMVWPWDSCILIS